MYTSIDHMKAIDGWQLQTQTEQSSKYGSQGNEWKPQESGRLTVSHTQTHTFTHKVNSPLRSHNVARTVLQLHS